MKTVEVCNRKTISLAIRLAPACKKRDVLHRCAGGAHQSSESRCALVNLRPAGAALVDMGYRVGANWWRDGAGSCCVGVAAERTEAPGRVPEGVKPRYCGQMDAKGDKVIKEEEAERRVKAIEAEGSKSGRWVGRIKLVLENSARRAGHVGCVFYFFDFDSRVMFICFSFSGWGRSHSR